MSYNKAWDVAYQRDRAAGRPRYVPAEPVRERLAQMVDAKVPLRTLGRVTGLSASAVKAIVDGDRYHVQRATAERVRQLSLQDLYLEQCAGHVPRVGAVRRVQALMAMGWTHRDIGQAGAPNSANLIASGGDLITVERWREVKQVYDRLSMTPGPSPRTKGWARALGYPPPLAWDDGTIDDPLARPQGDLRTGAGADVVDMVAVRRAVERPGAARELSPAERREVVRAMAGRGASDAQIGERLGVVDRTVLRMRQRHAIPSRSGRPDVDRSDSDRAEAQEITARPARRLERPTNPAPAAPPVNAVRR